MRPSKREELVQKALTIFYENGFHATGMDTLAIESGISKTSMYNHFRTKDELILAALRLRDEKFRNWLYRRMSELESSPSKQLSAMFDALGEWFKTPGFKGCMFVKASSEFQEPEHPIHKQCTEHKRLIGYHLLELAKKANLANPMQLVDKLMLLKEGAIVSAHLQSVECPTKLAKETAIALIESAKPT